MFTTNKDTDRLYVLFLSIYISIINTCTVCITCTHTYPVSSDVRQCQQVTLNTRTKKF